ncbi:MAG TPA: response regulator transcription factor [Opitutaceae bacterium]|nr:response regulator transcription factor [Opitutaceae bacterium]
MRVLVVDDEPTAQKVMQLFLARSGYTPIIHSDGSKVLELAQSEDPPPIIVLDWMLPGADGLTICRALRTAKLKSRPYIFMLSSKTNRDDVAAALDAGSDDYVTKPFHINELQARLRVAKRTIEYQQELLHQIADNEALHQRNSLLGELISKQQPAAVPAAPVVPPASLVPAPAVVSVPDAAPKPPKTDVLFTTHEIRYLLSATLMELRLVLERVTLRADVIEPKLVNYGAWSAIMLHSQGYWMDLLVLAKGEATGKLFAQSLGRASTSMGENEVFLAELARVVGLGFTRTLNARQASAGQPLLSRTLNFSGRTGLPRLPLDTKVYDLVIEGQEVQLLVMLSDDAAIRVSPSSLREGDILAESYPPPSRTEVPIFKDGVAMTPRFIGKLVDQMEVEPADWTLAIYRPSPLAKFFQRGVRTLSALD